jgi:hypothetical protein
MPIRPWPAATTGGLDLGIGRVPQRLAERAAANIANPIGFGCKLTTPFAAKQEFLRQ